MLLIIYALRTITCNECICRSAKYCGGILPNCRYAFIVQVLLIVKQAADITDFLAIIADTQFLGELVLAGIIALIPGVQVSKNDVGVIIGIVFTIRADAG